MKGPLSTCNPDGCGRHTAANKLKDIALQDLEDYTKVWPQSLQEYAIDIALINTILNKSSAHTKFPELFVKRILKGYGGVDITADC